MNWATVSMMAILYVPYRVGHLNGELGDCEHGDSLGTIEGRSSHNELGN